jgi:hypothetical protein
MENSEWLLNVNFNLSVRQGHYLISEGDLQYWLKCHLPRQTSHVFVAVKKHVRYAGDAVMIAEGIKGVRDGKWPNANQAALKLAGPDTAKADRLRRAIRKGL